MEPTLALTNFYHKVKLKSRLVLIAFLSALLVVSKEALSVIPNVEVVTLLLLVYTKLLGFKTSIYITIIFTTIQAIIYPPGLWIITYYIIWPILVLVATLLFKFNVNSGVIAIWAAVFGLGFGAVDSFLLSFVYGFQAFIPIWVRGLPWDLVHGFSNYLTVLILYEPLRKNFEKLIF